MHVPVFAGEGKLEYIERPAPCLTRPDDVIVAVRACGICGTDLNILAVPPAHKAKPGTILGHEGVGVVAETGPKVHGLSPGDRVVIAPRLTCGRCRYCRRGLDNQCENYTTVGITMDGAFAPYVRVPEQGLYRVSNAVADADAALFEPLSCVVGAVARAPVQPGDNVAIIGAGPMGALFALMYRSLGAGKIIMIDLAPYRLEFAQQLGADAVINPAQESASDVIQGLTDMGCDLVVDAVGNQLGNAIKLARRGGQVVLFGLHPHDNPTVNQYTITRYDLNVIGAFVGLNPFPQTVQLLESGILQPSQLITQSLPLSELMQGVELMRSGEAMKVLIENEK